MTCNKQKQRKTRYCNSDFRRSIKIWCGSTVATAGDYDVTNDKLLFEGRARVEVKSGSPFFYGTSIEDTPTHDYKIRYNPDLEIEKNNMIEELREHLVKYMGDKSQGVIDHIEGLEKELADLRTVQANKIAAFQRVAEQEKKKAETLHMERDRLQTKNQEFQERLREAANEIKTLEAQLEDGEPS